MSNINIYCDICKVWISTSNMFIIYGDKWIPALPASPQPEKIYTCNQCMTEYIKFKNVFKYCPDCGDKFGVNNSYICDCDYTEDGEDESEED